MVRQKKSLNGMYLLDSYNPDTLKRFMKIHHGKFKAETPFFYRYTQKKIIKFTYTDSFKKVSNFLK